MATTNPTPEREAEIRAWAAGSFADGKPHIPEGVPSFTRDLLAMLDRERERTREYARMLCANAHALFLSTLRGRDGSLPRDRETFDRMKSPRPGDYVFEISTIYAPDRDQYRFGKLLSCQFEPYPKEPDDDDDDGEPPRMRKVWRIELPDGRPYWWDNAEFLAVMAEAKPT